jgi:hypothetical protein
METKAAEIYFNSLQYSSIYMETEEYQDQPQVRLTDLLPENRTSGLLNMNKECYPQLHVAGTKLM